MLLGDNEIETLLRASTPIIEGFNAARLSTNDSPVRGASLNLTIGDIFVPGVAKDELGGLNNSRQSLSLQSGQTAVLRSAEVLQMPKNVAGVGFPPSSKVSLAGLLSTNPGHIDPDYKGPVHLTVVNMGQDSFHLYKGEIIMRVMLFKLNRDVTKFVGAPPSPLTEELLSRLSHNFLDIDERARKAAKGEELRLRSIQVWGTIGTAIVTAIVTATLALLYQGSSAQRDIAKMEGRLGTLGGTLNLTTFDEQVRKIGTLEDRIKNLEFKK